MIDRAYNLLSVSRLFTPKIADFYESYYKSKGILFIKRNALASFENDFEGKVILLCF